MGLNCNILHLEDDDNDSFFFQRALGQLHFHGTYRRVCSVEEAIEYFTGSGDFANRRLYPLPHVLVADNSLRSTKTTAQLMAWLKERSELPSLTTIMLTGAGNTMAVQQPLPEGVTRVLQKRADLDELSASVEKVLKGCIPPS